MELSKNSHDWGVPNHTHMVNAIEQTPTLWQAVYGIEIEIKNAETEPYSLFQICTGN